MKSLSLHEQFERYRREDQAKEADRQRRIVDCAQDILAIMPDRWQLPSSVLIEILSRYIP